MLRSAVFVACVAAASAFGLAPQALRAPLAAATRQTCPTSKPSLLGLQMNRNRTRLISTPKWRRIAEKKAARLEAAKHLSPEEFVPCRTISKLSLLQFAAYMAKQGFARKKADLDYKTGPEAVARRKSEKK
jgi:DNA-binding transcriptional regulator YiaG